ncbi:SdiA-regulated domain-containing protein [Gillisia sp. M10.2A]|uniref:SdiA-regulated domain-containing protein n=1 Tax=Gillisia lutea TaxID=2909668 RepID=A0ABS9EF57_9FLAO|nr:SdiA-regulated domain-containing protein [Gillisia lutea]MCF4101517.1 SdiA-regulated domain-containing protein [Gillisia lutea]
MQRTVLLIVIGVLGVVGIIYYAFHGTAPNFDLPNAQALKIVQKWELPDALEEISGIAWISGNKILCVQDEDGILFIYDLASSKIERKIDFEENGDFEGVALIGKKAYVLESNGTIFEIEDIYKEDPKTYKYKYELKENYNFEGLCYDRNNNQLLLAVKDKAGKNKKPVFAFDLSIKAINEKPVFRIDYEDAVFNKLDQKKNNSRMNPSEIGINPVTEDIYILEGKNPKLLILNATGKAKELYVLKEGQFPQAEGLTFSKDGKLYISNEGQGGAPNILQVTLD